MAGCYQMHRELSELHPVVLSVYDMGHNEYTVTQRRMRSLYDDQVLICTEREKWKCLVFSVPFERSFVLHLEGGDSSDYSFMVDEFELP